MSSPSLDPPELDFQVKGSLPSGPSPGAAYLRHQLHHHNHLPPPPPPPPPSPPPLPPLQPSNPLEAAPSAPPQIYLNLLILEASLRSQYLNHLSRRRKFTFFLVLLCLWTAFFGYRFVVLGGSPYYYFSHFEKLGLGGGVGTGMLYYATGLYHKTIVEPRRFVSVANRGLRGFNVKLVKIPLSYREWFCWWWGWYTFRPPPHPSSHPSHPSQQPSQHPSQHPSQPHAAAAPRRPSSSTRRPTPPVPSHSHNAPSLSSMAALQRPLLARKDHRDRGNDTDAHDDDGDDDDEIEEYLPGGLHLKLVILPKGFSPDFREGWELYRTVYWDKENEVRQARREELARMRHAGPPSTSPAGGGGTPFAVERHVRATRASSVSSLRGRTPTPDPDHGAAVLGAFTPPGRARRGSTASLKRRSITGTPLPPPSPSRAGTPAELSDSGSATSAMGGDRDRDRERERARRSETHHHRRASGRGRETNLQQQQQ